MRRHGRTLLTLLLRVDAGAFTFVMATGIVSVGASQQHLPRLSDVLLALAVAGSVLLGLAVGIRAVRERRRVVHLHAFALVAATAVLGTRLGGAGFAMAGLALWALAVLFWFVLLAQGPRLRGAGAGSLLLVVATQSLAVLGSVLAPRFSTGLVDAAIAYWLLGLALYPLVLVEVGRSFLRRSRFSPDHWVVMGALAIATLAAARLFLAAGDLHALRNAIWLRNLALATWAVASALIPALLLADLRARRTWRYVPSRWSFVFPLAMYGVATATLGGAAGLPELLDVGRVFFAVALAAWGVVSLGLARAVFLHVCRGNVVVR